MCTASWAPRPDGYTFCFNRDERRTRAPALPPAARDADGIAFLAPLDGDFGGTWIAVNQFGITLALLNRYQHAVAPEPREPRSRGLIILDLIAAANLATIETGLRRLPHDQHRPFSLLAIAPGSPAMIAAWNGRALVVTRHANPGLILTSSSVTEPEVALARTATFAALSPVSAESLEAVHRSHRPERGRRSVCMHRPEAETQSYSRIEVTPEGVRMRHIAGSPCLLIVPAPQQFNAGPVELHLQRAKRPALRATPHR